MTRAMPLIMEDGINVDDLFGESTLELGIPSTSTKGLAQRLEEMRLLGCCQKIDWSRIGCIAYISQDSLRVNVRHLQCRPSDGKWVLSEDTPLHPVTETHGGQPLVHLSWSEIGNELAVADSCGRVSVHSVLNALNTVQCSRQAFFDPSDDASQLVAMMWLNLNRSVHAFHQAAKLNGRWGYSPYRRRPVGPFHPANKGALVYITRSGQIKLLYQHPDSKWAEISAELKNTGYSDRLLTHAALAATQAGIIVATYSACQKICVYRVQIVWNPASWDANQAKQTSSTNPFPTPSFRFVHLKVEKPNNMPALSGSLAESPVEGPLYLNSLYSLTRLEVIPGPLDTTTSPWLIAVFSHAVHVAPEPSEPHGPASIIVRWQLDTVPQSLHPQFDEVLSNKSNIQSKQEMELRRLEVIHCDRHIVSMDHTEYGNVLSITFDDSSLTFYDLKTLHAFNGIEDTNTVTSLVQAGFNYPVGPAGLYASFSPNACVAVMLDGDWEMHLRVMEHSLGADDGLYDDSKFSAAIAALALAFCRGCGSDTNGDDIIVVAMRQLSPDAKKTFVNEVYRALPINCNFTTDYDKLMNHTYIPRCLSLQAALGFKERYKPRDLTSALPWAILNLRHASLVFASFLQYRGQQPDSADPDILRMVFGNTKWALDFSCYVLDRIFALAESLGEFAAGQEALAQKIKFTVSLPLLALLSSMSRAFLRFICRGLRGIYQGFANGNMLSNEARLQYGEICHTLHYAPVRIDVFEKFLAGVDSAVRHAYQAAGFGDAERPGPEKELLMNARIPAVLLPAVVTIFRQTIPAVKPEVDRLKMYLRDYSWLGFEDERLTLQRRKAMDVDILKKTPLGVVNRYAISEGHDRSGDMRLSLPSCRRCVRCCELSGDTNMPRSLPFFRLVAKVAIIRSCLCGALWTMESGSSVWSNNPSLRPESLQSAVSRVNPSSGNTLVPTAGELAGSS